MGSLGGLVCGWPRLLLLPGRPPGSTAGGCAVQPHQAIRIASCRGYDATGPSDSASFACMRVVRVKPFGGGCIRSLSFFGSFKSPQVINPSLVLYLRFELATAHAHAFDLCLAVRPSVVLVLAVLSTRRTTQVVKPVVRRETVFVVNLEFRECPVNVKPSQPVSSVAPAVHHDSDVPILVWRPRNSPGLVTSDSGFSCEQAGFAFINQNGSQALS